MDKRRIELLDGFRFIAILCVLLYHYTNKWVDFYPYGNFFRHIFSFGFLGVQFFFMISGFVISYTLENTNSLLAFFRNRIARLFPPMLLCAIITWLLALALDNQYLFPHAHQPKNFLPSLTFINPEIFSLTTKKDFSWISGSYWSLWVEVQFYAIASVLYFLNKKNFFRNMLLVGIAISLEKYIPIFLLQWQQQNVFSGSCIVALSRWKHMNELLNISFFIEWFLAGVIIFHLYKGINIIRNTYSGICAATVLFCLLLHIRAFNTGYFYAVFFATLIMIGLFLLMIYRKKYLFFLQSSLLSRIGVISYSIYLIHEVNGVLLINIFGGYLGKLSMLSPLIVIILMICFAELSYRFYERKAGLVLKKIFNGLIGARA